LPVLVLGFTSLKQWCHGKAQLAGAIAKAQALFEVGVNGGLVTSLASGIGGTGNSYTLVSRWLLVGLVIADGFRSYF